MVPVRRAFIDIDNTPIHWSEMGSGRPLVLLHGLCDSHFTWGRVAPDLARTHRVLMPDLPGHGLSGRPDATYALQWHAEVMGKWLTALDLADADVVGHSFGGGVAQFLMVVPSPPIRKLGLVSSGGLGREVSLGLRFCAATRAMERWGQPLLSIGTRLGLGSLGSTFASEEVEQASWMNGRPGTARAFSRTICDVIDWRGQRRHFLDRAREVGSLPQMALYWGNHDPVIPVSHALEVMQMIQNVGLTRFECGHFPHRECSSQFSAALQGFLDADEFSRAFILLSPQLRPPRQRWWSRAWRAVSGFFGGLFGQRPTAAASSAR